MSLFFLGNGVLAFSGLLRLLGALYLPPSWLVLAGRVSSVPPGGQLSTLPCWSCILGGLA